MKEMKETIELMNSEDYKERFKAEYWQVKIRREKLHKVLVKYDAGTLTFEPICDVQLLKGQEAAMDTYIGYLEVRAEIEKIDLED